MIYVKRLMLYFILYFGACTKTSKPVCISHAQLSSSLFGSGTFQVSFSHMSLEPVVLDSADLGPL